MAYLWSNPYGFTVGEWFALTTWQKIRMFFWRHRYMRGFYCLFLKCRARREFLRKSLKGEDFQCKCERAKYGGACSCKSGVRCWQDGYSRFCWCRCTPDGTLSQGVGDETKYISCEDTTRTQKGFSAEGESR